MKKITIVLVLIMSFCISFSFLSMGKIVNGEIVRDTPLNNDNTEDYGWTWITDEICVEFDVSADVTKSYLTRMYEMGLLSRWAEPTNDGNGMWKAKKRDAYAGKWSQNESGVWSFAFADKTIPVGITKIDNELYAFNGLGQLQDGFIYYEYENNRSKSPFDEREGLKTGADGLVTSDDPAFLEWLETQYVPECFTQQEETGETEATQ